MSDSVSVREVKTWFHTQPNVRSLAVAKADGNYGIITREKLNASLLEGSNDSEFLNQRASSIMDPAPFSVKGSMPIQEIMEMLVTLRGQEDNFFEDIIVHDQEQKFLGLVSVRDVVVDQLAGLMHRLTAMDAQQSALAKQNKELFENSFRQGQRETQFRSYFDVAPVPIIIFDRDGKFLAANLRFQRLSGYAPKQFDTKFHFEKFFANQFTEVLRTCTENGHTGEEDGQVLTLIPLETEPLNVDVITELSPDWGHLVISIMGIEDSESKTISRTSHEIIAATAAKPAGKITQAIKNKLQGKGAHGLGRSVATNLIDREEQVDRLMKKLEQIISVADEVEKHKTTEPIANEEVTDEREHLKGNIAEFSIIDLCQIIIQGTKTGQLLVFAHSENDLTAYIYFYCGSIVHAKHRDGLEAEKALPPILAIKTGKFDFIFNKSTPKTTIQGDPMGILMEACRQADEAENQQ